MVSATAPPRNARLAGCIVIGLAAYSWVAGHFVTFSRSAAIATFIPGLLGVIAALWFAPRGSCRPDRSRRGWLAWWLVILGLSAIELISLAFGSTTAHPTVSDLVNPWLLSTPSRAVAFVLWLSFGYWLSRR